MPPQYSVSPNPRVPFEICYEDEHLIVLNKPASIVTQPGAKHTYDTLLNGAFDRWGNQLQNLGKKRDFGLLHRLDRGTSGLVIIALTPQSYDGMRALFETRNVKKRYWTLVSGHVQNLSGVCDSPILERRVNGKKQAVVNNFSTSKGSAIHHRRNDSGRRSSQGGKTFGAKNLHGREPRKGLDQRSHHNEQLIPLKGQAARTEFRVLETHHSALGPIAFIECSPHTGRLHQIRVHMRTLELSVIGDFDYGGNTQVNQAIKSLGRDRLMLHAGYLEFVHPITHLLIQIEAPLPDWWSTFIQQLKLNTDLLISSF